MTDPDPRRQGRVLALQLLYSWELNKGVEDAVLVPPEDDESVPEIGRTLAHELFEGFKTQRTAIDAAIDQRLENWTIHRLAATDRAILRLGAYEILYRAEIPPRVAINEGVELAKQFGSDGKTARLVNGVLDRIARDHRPTEVKKRPPAPVAPASPA